MKPYLKLYRFLCLLLAGSLACGAAYADAKSKTLLDALTTRMNGYNSYEVQFTVRMDQEFGDMPGRIVVSGNRYYVSVNGAEVFFDGKVRQTYNSRDNEVVIETPDPSDNNILSNPARFFRLYDQDFNHVYQGTAIVGGKNAEVVRLTPKQSGSGYASILLQLDPITKLPLGVVYNMEDSDAARITIRKITPNVPVQAAAFTFDKSKHKGVEVIDFR